MKFIFEVRMKPGYTVDEYAEAWVQASNVIRRTSRQPDKARPQAWRLPDSCQGGGGSPSVDINRSTGMNKLFAVAALTAAGYFLRNQMKKQWGTSGRMSTATESIELEVPVSTAYNQWTQFEEFPKFMTGVLQVTQLDDTHLHWRARVGGKEEEWDAEITKQIPDRLIAWRSTSGTPNEGQVTFRSVGDNRTHVELRLDYEPRGAVEAIGGALGAVNMQAGGSLRRFKSFLEERGRETGAWRGTVSGSGSVAQTQPA